MRWTVYTLSAAAGVAESSALVPVAAVCTGPTARRCCELCRPQTSECVQVMSTLVTVLALHWNWYFDIPTTALVFAGHSLQLKWLRLSMQGKSRVDTNTLRSAPSGRRGQEPKDTLSQRQVCLQPKSSATTRLTLP